MTDPERNVQCVEEQEPRYGLFSRLAAIPNPPDLPILGRSFTDPWGSRNHNQSHHEDGSFGDRALVPVTIRSGTTPDNEIQNENFLPIFASVPGSCNTVKLADLRRLPEQRCLNMA